MAHQASKDQSRLPVTERAAEEDRPPFRMSERDQAIVAAVYTHRTLTSTQIETLFFPDSDHTRCNKRLKRLFHHGFLERAEQPQSLTEGRKPLLYMLDERGARLLANLRGVDREAIDWHPRHNEVGHTFLDHLLETNNVRVAIERAAQQAGWEIETWHNERTLKSREMKDHVTLVGPKGGRHCAAVIPDGYFALNTGQYRYHHMLEVDRATLTGRSPRWARRDWARKIRVYMEFVKQGLYQKRYGTKSLRVLTVTIGERRMQNLKEITEYVGEEGRGDVDWFWFTTFDKATPDQILTEPVWLRAGEDEPQRLIS